MVLNIVNDYTVLFDPEVGLTGTIIPIQTRLGSNNNEVVVNIPQSPRTQGN